MIATATNTVIGSAIPFGISPFGVAVTLDRRWIKLCFAGRLSASGLVI